ncbi:drug/metabolite transporter (DMT)-like permease [Leucobacter exalbidus]|uniref:Drug/metabolite transporter (DMT)-like permease n=1 Tax=Leucobacter exalbidus TaxID=662960 RepID=A0A940PMJ8_9MICO|nr:multidrug DMT transporter permease [Leucobacter exalbidus]MBP1325898.1 drug/metabolite transporter (DMT)-like permease [Leucobacter exalbidus]
MSEMASAPVLGIGLAIASATALAIGNMLQAKGVHEIEDAASNGANGSKFVNLVRNHIWLLGAVLLGISILFQMGSLAFAPLMVVQPLGVVALVITVLATSLISKRTPTVRVVRSIVICVVGVAGFVTVAAMVTTQHPITNTQLVAVLAVLGGVLLATGIILALGRHRRSVPLLWVLLGGVYSAFVATLGKTVILRVQAVLKSHEFHLNTANILTLGCLIGIAVAGLLSIYFVQRAHIGNRPEVVVAGLTVIDPAIAVVLSITILGEASGAPVWAVIVFIVAGATAIGGVFALSNAEGVTTDPAQDRPLTQDLS